MAKKRKTQKQQRVNATTASCEDEDFKKRISLTKFTLKSKIKKNEKKGKEIKKEKIKLMPNDINIQNLFLWLSVCALPTCLSVIIRCFRLLLLSAPSFSYLFLCYFWFAKRISIEMWLYDSVYTLFGPESTLQYHEFVLHWAHCMQ